MTGPARLHLDPERRARRRALALLATAALVSALIGLLFVNIWKSYVESLEPEYFREQGAQWGREFQRRIQDNTNRFMKSARADEVRYWREYLDKDSFRYFEDEFRRNPSLRPRQISLLFRQEDGPFETAMRIGRDLSQPPPSDSFRLDPETGFAIAVSHQNELVAVVVDGPVEGVGPEIADNLRFRLVLEFRPFHLVTQRGTTYAAILVTLYLGIIYLLFILVFRLGRRQMQLALSAKEKSIRLKAISSVAEGIAHEVRNPLNAISLNVQYMEKLENKPGFKAQPEDFQRIYRELGKIRKVIDNFVNFAKSKDLEISRWSLGEVMDGCLKNMAPRFKEAKVEVSCGTMDEAILSGDRHKMTQVLESLLENAVEAMAGEEEKAINVEVTETHDTVCAAIRNSGPTPDDEVIKNMFDPYFTTRRGSLGLGLTLARTAVESHGGQIQATAAPGGGLVVTVTLPRVF